MENNTVKQQIEILKLTLKKLKNESIISGICYEMRSSIYDITGDYICFHEIVDIIPSFNIDNAHKLSKKYNFNAPKNDSEYWWDIGLREPRIKFVKALIKELKKL